LLIGNSQLNIVAPNLALVVELIRA